MNVPKTSLPRIVIIGAGFAGLKLARKLNTKHYQLVLIDKNNFHTFQPLLYQVASSGLEPDSIAYPIRKTLQGKPNTYYRLAKVNSIDLDNKKVKTNIGEVEYNHLVIATGATNNFFGNENLEANAVPMKSLVDALDLRSKILGNFEKALNTTDLAERDRLMNFVIVGAGPTGVELSGALAELKSKILPKDFPDLDLRQMRINLVEAENRVLSSMSKESSTKAEKYLKDLGVNVWKKTFVKHYQNDIITTSGETFHSTNLIWAAGVMGDFPGGINSENIGRSNRIIINEFCAFKNNPNVFVLGDAGLIQTEIYPNGLPMLGSVAMQQGDYLATQFNNKLKGKSAKPFIYSNKGTMATIGRNQAVVELKKFKFQGILAWFVWMFVHLMLLVGFRNRTVVFINWAWNYIRFNNGSRVIVRPYNKV